MMGFGITHAGHKTNRNRKIVTIALKGIREVPPAIRSKLRPNFPPTMKI